MNGIANFILDRPKTYLPLFGIAITWIVDGLAEVSGLPIRLNPEVKEMITILLATLSVALLRRNAVKTKDLDKKVEEMQTKIVEEVERRNKGKT